jgi:hypothetical protein
VRSEQWHENLIAINKNKVMQKNKDRIPKKEEVIKRIDKLDPNNNKNIEQKPVVKRRGKKVHDDGFEHRSSKETAL